jgi:hypothetical protein
MNDIIVWDNGEENDTTGRYTLLYGGMSAFIFGENAKEDHRNVEKISKAEVDIQDMDKRYKRISHTILPVALIEAIKKRA